MYFAFGILKRNHALIRYPYCQYLLIYHIVTHATSLLKRGSTYSDTLRLTPVQKYQVRLHHFVIQTGFHEILQNLAGSTIVIVVQ